MQKKVTLLRCTQNKQALTHSVLVKSRRPKRVAHLGAVSTAVPVCHLSAGPQRHTWGPAQLLGKTKTPPLAGPPKLKNAAQWALHVTEERGN